MLLAAFLFFGLETWVFRLNIRGFFCKKDVVR